MCGIYPVRVAQYFSLAPTGIHSSWNFPSGYSLRVSLPKLCSWATYGSNSVEVLLQREDVGAILRISLYQLCSTRLLRQALAGALACIPPGGLSGPGWAHRLWKLAHESCVRGVTGPIGGVSSCFRYFLDCDGCGDGVVRRRRVDLWGPWGGVYLCTRYRNLGAAVQPTIEGRGRLSLPVGLPISPRTSLRLAPIWTIMLYFYDPTPRSVSQRIRKARQDLRQSLDPVPTSGGYVPALRRRQPQNPA